MLLPGTMAILMAMTTMATNTPTATTVPQNGHVEYVYDGDGNLVKSIIDGVETYYPNRAYELKVSGSNEVITRHYSAGSSRIAYRINGAITWLLNDHLGLYRQPSRRVRCLCPGAFYAPRDKATHNRYTNIVCL
mgnify:CR=1 FL=1